MTAIIDLSAIIDFDLHSYYGVRSDDREFQIGDILPCSLVWIDGTPTEEELDGTCATQIGQYDDPARIIARHEREGYIGSKYIIAGCSATYGEDSGEIIVRDAVVVAVL